MNSALQEKLTYAGATIAARRCVAVDGAGGRGGAARGDLDRSGIARRIAQRRPDPLFSSRRRPISVRTTSRCPDTRDCARQRNLTDRGRAEAQRIGSAIKRLAIPIDDVMASPFCRTMETARLIFGRATATAAVRGGPARAESPERYAELRKLLSTPRPVGANLAIVSHGNPFANVVGPPYLAEGEAAVIRPLEAAASSSSRRIPKDGWDGARRPVAPSPLAVIPERAAFDQRNASARLARLRGRIPGFAGAPPPRSAVLLHHVLGLPVQDFLLRFRGRSRRSCGLICFAFAYARKVAGRALIASFQRFRCGKSSMSAFAFRAAPTDSSRCRRSNSRRR